MKSPIRSLIILWLFFLMIIPAHAAPVMERLDRGLVAVSLEKQGVYLSWRLLGTDDPAIGFNLYRDSEKINDIPITESTNFIDPKGTTESKYHLNVIIDSVEQDASPSITVWPNFFHEISINRPPTGTLPDGSTYSYSANDASVADLDGDMQYEIVLKWDPSNSKDNSRPGFTGPVFLDAYELDGTQLWRINLGPNIRAGAHYTQFLVYDFDSDGCAELACKTADGTIDSNGDVIGDPMADWHNDKGYILDGPEYLTVFDGQTGRAVDTVDYLPQRGDVCKWGDCYGNRIDRFLACAAYLDGHTPSMIFCRGYYTRTVLAAWDYKDKHLVKRWVFDSDKNNRGYASQGNHNLTVADVDQDGRDEIIYGSCTIDDNGKGLYTTKLGHGDAMHVSDMDPDRPGLELWQCHETSIAGATFRDAKTGEIIFQHDNPRDVGRACAAHIDARYPGYQFWSPAKWGTYNLKNEMISRQSPPVNFLVWWTGDLQREFLNGIDRAGKNMAISKWTGDGLTRVLSLYQYPTPYATAGNNYTKSNPCLTADILGDWREEILLRASGSSKLYLFTSTHPTTHRLYTLMHDPQYRLSIVWQNVAYNQPPHTSYYIGQNMAPIEKPDISFPEN